MTEVSVDMDALVAEVKADFLSRREERRAVEQQWSLNMNYLMGNQYCEISPNGEIAEEDAYYFWQNRNVYNHIAPVIETRIAKLARVRPSMSVRAQGADDNDVKTAKIVSNVLGSTCQRIGLDGVISKATLLSEVFGSAFYKVVWNGEKGRILGDVGGDNVFEGDVDITAISPFEIYPDSLFHDGLDSVKSLIHARAMHVDDIEEQYGVRVDGADIDVFKMDTVHKSSYGHSKLSCGVVHDNAIVIERYERPSKKYPFGRVVTIAGDKVLFIGELPYVNGVDGKRDFPFVKQDCLALPNCFFGTSIVERLIPLQRSYNAVKNRKHEFINRLSMGVLTVEDGSIDTDELVDEGLQPGKVIVYRQGSTPPKMMNVGSVPIEFTYEEERLTNEFITISGVSEVSRGASLPDNVTSGVALQVLLEQDETRLATSAEMIKRAIKTVAKQIIRLFKQFSSQTRMMKIAGESQKAEVFYFNASDITSDDVVFDTENEISSTPAQKKSAVLELFATGLLSGSDGKVDERTKAKILDMMGFGSLENAKDLTNLHISRAELENVEIESCDQVVEEYDDHEIHILEHTRYLLSGEAKKRGEVVKQKLIEHIRAHKNLMGNNLA